MFHIRGAASGMLRISFCILCCSAVVLALGDASWSGKPISEWKSEDAKQVLANSPWVKNAAFALLPERSESQLREGGRMGGGGKRAGLASGLAPPRTLVVRWESAAAVRAAEVLAAESGSPDWDGDYYAIAVYDVPGITPGLQNSLHSELRDTAFLKREGKKDVRPERVEISFLGGRTARLLYLFPRSAAITADNKTVVFVTQIGRMYVSQVFNTVQMELQGRLQL
jgi:hypothetical protein